MASYSVVIRRSAEKEIERLPDAVRRRVVERIRGLAGEEGYRIRQGDWRIVYTIDDTVVTVVVVRVRHRSDVYR